VLRAIKNVVGEAVRRGRTAYLRRLGVQVGDGCFISSGAWIDTWRGAVVIGHGVTITNGSKVLSHDHARLRVTAGMSEGTHTVIGDRVVIGMNAIVLPGVTVGADSIIGAGAVVAKDVPPGSLVIGQAARVVKRLDPDGTCTHAPDDRGAQCSRPWVAVDPAPDR
jgi:acetyltransferase-like isoleucine patch superfamily enzyme